MAKASDSEAQALRRETERSEKQKLKSKPAVQQQAPLKADMAGLVDDTTAVSDGSWKNIIWREWSRAEDKTYADYLYPLVKTSALGWKFVAAFALGCAIGGAILGLFLGAVLTNFGVQAGFWQPTVTPALLFTWGFSLVGGVFGVWSSRAYRTWHYWWQGQPPLAKVEEALRQACHLYPEVERLWDKPLHRLTLEKVRHRPLPQLITELDNPDWSYRFAARLALAARGGEAVAALRPIAIDQEHPLWEVATWLLTNIEHETRNAYAWRTNDTVCPHCFTRFSAHPLELPLGISFTYYGCRLCRQSEEHFYVPSGVVAVLDNRHNETPVVQDGLLRVNWLTRRELFDFDRVEIIQATDEVVEHFAVQVGNDTDPARVDHYQQMRCLVSCVLSQNTLRVLRHTFGVVEVAA